MDWCWSYTLIKPTTCTTNSVRLQGLESIFMTHSKSSNPTFQLLNITFFSTIPSPDEYGISLAPNTATSLSVQVNEMTRLPSPYKSKCMKDWSSTGFNVSVSNYSLSVSVNYITSVKYVFSYVQFTAIMMQCRKIAVVSGQNCLYPLLVNMKNSFDVIIL